ncbi:NAD(P)H-binding protein [Streptosporangium sp. NPDC020072]|uniref:SDR family oxidoreductase n=1 Tax=Streptosporangium sp. NPDC020072 TaxID=3154788 RepID=UPI003448EA15
MTGSKRSRPARKCRCSAVIGAISGCRSRTAAAVADRPAAHARRVVYLSAPHRTPHPFFRQPNPMAALHAEIERLIAATGLDATIVRPGMFASNALLWWSAAIRGEGVVRWPYGAAETAPIDDRDVAEVIARILREDGHAGGDYVTSTVSDPLGRPARTFRQWVADHAASFTGGPAAGSPSPAISPGR